MVKIEKQLFTKYYNTTAAHLTFRNIFEIKKAIKTFFNKKCSSMVGVTEMIEHPRECVIKNKIKFLINKQPNKKEDKITKMIITLLTVASIWQKQIF